MSPWQFIVLCTTIIIAIFGGGFWLLGKLVLQEPEKQSETKQELNIEQEIQQPDGLSQDPQTLTRTPNSPVPKSPPDSQRIWKYRYNVASLPTWSTSDRLERIIAEITQQAEAQGLPSQAMSVVLMDLNQGAIASHQARSLQYPASVAKLFWMTALFGQFNQGLLNEADFQNDLPAMISRSDNNATSRIIDEMTRTQFQKQGSNEDYQAWLTKREQLNLFFNEAGYQDLNITQKTYPITDIEIFEPQGFDLEMRQNPVDANQPIRNQLSAWHAARLMSEIATQQAITPQASQKMLQLLQRDLSQDWSTATIDYFNPVENFFGSGLPPETRFYSKAGWTSQGRHEVAFIATPDGNTQYIFCIFADNEAYASNTTFFPEIAQFVHDKMTTQNLSQKD